MSAVEIVDSYVSALPGETRRLAHGEWGITVDPEQAAGAPLHVGLRIAEAMLLAQAFVMPRDDLVDPWALLSWNRQTRHIRFACARSRDVWIHADLPVGAVDERSVDRLLGLVAEGALVARRYAAARAAAGGA